MDPNFKSLKAKAKAADMQLSVEQEILNDIDKSLSSVNEKMAKLQERKDELEEIKHYILHPDDDWPRIRKLVKLNN